MSRKNFKNINKEIEIIIQDRIIQICSNIECNEEMVGAILSVNANLATTTRSKTKQKEEKRPLTGYITYCNESRPQLKKEHPDIKGKDIIKELAAAWKRETPEVRNEYNEKAKQAKKIVR